MTHEQQCVAEFMRTFNQTIPDGPAIPADTIISLRKNLIYEEMSELFKAFSEHDLNAIADGLGDLLYVIYGAGLAFGLDLEPIFNEVHRSNMTKLGGTIREDGKLIKPSSYSPPNFWWLRSDIRYEEGQGHD